MYALYRDFCSNIVWEILCPFKNLIRAFMFCWWLVWSFLMVRSMFPRDRPLIFYWIPKRRSCRDVSCAINVGTTMSLFRRERLVSCKLSCNPVIHPEAVRCPWFDRAPSIVTSLACHAGHKPSPIVPGVSRCWYIRLAVLPMDAVKVSGWRELAPILPPNSKQVHWDIDMQILSASWNSIQHIQAF